MSDRINIRKLTNSANLIQSTRLLDESGVANLSSDWVVSNSVSYFLAEQSTWPSWTA